MAHMGKNPRILQIYTMLLQGESVSKESLAREYEVSEKSIQRDIEDLREFWKIPCRESLCGTAGKSGSTL